MHSIIHPIKPNTYRISESAETFRDPHYECVQMGDDLKLVVYTPGVDAAGVEITQRGPDLIVTARKAHVVRVNWKALHLEGAQRDYRLRLRLGNHLDYESIRAEIHEGVLTIVIPRAHSTALSERVRRVA